MTPLVIRPRRSLIMASSLSAVLVLSAGFGWLALPPQIQAQFTLPQVLTLLFFVAVMVAFMMSIGLSYVRLDDAGLTWRNGLRTHRLAWTQVVGFRFTTNDSWAFVQVDDDPEFRPLMAIQRTDRDRSLARFAELQRRHRDAAR